MLFSSPYSFAGIRIHVPKCEPKLQLSADCPVTDDYRKEINEWLIEYLGYQEPAYPQRGQLLSVNGYLIMHPDDFERLKVHPEFVALQTDKGRQP